MSVKDFKILHVIDTLNIGGAESVFIDVCNLLHKNQINVTALFLLERGLLKDKLDKNLTFFELRRKKKWSVLKMRECYLILSQFDIIHCHSRHVYRYIKLIAIFSNIKGPIIFHEHSSNKKIPKYFDTILKPKFIISASNEMALNLKKAIKINDKNVFILPNSIEKISDNKLINLDKKYDFLLVSNFKENKNIRFIIELMEKLNSSLLLIGQENDKNYYNNIVNEIKLKNINADIKTSITNVQQLVKNAQIGLHASKNETGPLVLIEYLAQGLPFLAYDTGEVATILKKYYPEFFIDNFDISNWEERINIIKSKVYNKNDMLAIFNKYFSSEIYLHKILNIYLCIKN